MTNGKTKNRLINYNINQSYKKDVLCTMDYSSLPGQDNRDG